MKKSELKKFCLSKITIVDFAKYHNCSVDDIQQLLKFYNLKKRQANYLTQSEISKINSLYSKNNTIRDIHSKTGHGMGTIVKYIQIHKTKEDAKKTSKFRTKSKSGLNHYVFDTIIKKSAYALGLIMTDGSVDKSGYRISYHSKDEELIKIMRRIFHLTGSSYKSKDGEALRFNSIYMVKAIAKFGIYPNKTFTMRMPKLDNHYNHFFRGVIDGDGGIDIQKGCLIVRLTSGSFYFLNDIKNYLFQNLKIYSSLSFAGETAYLLRITGKKNAIPFCEYIYKNSNGLRLNRKYFIFKKAYT